MIKTSSWPAPCRPLPLERQQQDPTRRHIIWNASAPRRVALLAGSLPERTAFRAAQSIGYAITEVKYPSLRNRANEVIQSLIDKVSDA